MIKEESWKTYRSAALIAKYFETDIKCENLDKSQQIPILQKMLSYVNGEIQEDPNFVEAYEIRAKLHTKLGESRSAEADIVKVRELAGLESAKDLEFFVKVMARNLSQSPQNDSPNEV